MNSFFSRHRLSFTRFDCIQSNPGGGLDLAVIASYGYGYGLVNWKKKKRATKDYKEHSILNIKKR